MTFVRSRGRVWLSFTIIARFTRRGNRFTFDARGVQRGRDAGAMFAAAFRSYTHIIDACPDADNTTYVYLGGPHFCGVAHVEARAFPHMEYVRFRTWPRACTCVSHLRRSLCAMAHTRIRLNRWKALAYRFAPAKMCGFPGTFHAKKDSRMGPHDPMGNVFKRESVDAPWAYEDSRTNVDPRDGLGSTPCGNGLLRFSQERSRNPLY